ncbi:hypothetical protein LEMA_P110020.1 [Plenodomus lingam JN3]|uniref:SRR1-like domain-containing protein n=1 Tax=Leptosphaeria maculans (strain JN3 / isolate v23.1.3 / race Av1-4-5-6-7-8) TaxID=985895 RepID=E4ZZE2_LEPMJ|nr:hypothetical protein LEMA_P110020.1 [Plenodomus lingam JN3]CBX96737.1 hypothetical protein LEMA_P110020.1 [Plenodomus lingam JN3]
MRPVNKIQQATNVFDVSAGLQQDLSIEDDDHSNARDTSYPSDTTTASSDDIEQLSEDDQMFFEFYDLVVNEEQNSSAPVFSRVLLESICDQKRTLVRDFDLEDEERTIRHLEYHFSSVEVTKVWQDYHKEDVPEWLLVRYPARVELIHEFHSRFGKYSRHIQLLQKYSDLDSVTHLLTPYSFESSNSFNYILLEEHKDPGVMKAYHVALKIAMAIWLESDARDQFQMIMSAAAIISNPIKRIVCFGLGQIQFTDNAWNGSVLQHLAVFTVIKVLETRYKESGLDNRPIDILFQDPSYEKKDWILVRELHRAMGCGEISKVYSVTDPEGLLAVDTNTFVVTAFLPFKVPLMQIVADLFASSSGPAAFICDKMALDTTKWYYKLHDRDSPAVARFFAQR